MKSNEGLKEISINNCTCYYFNDASQNEDFDNISVDEKSYENILVYVIS